MKNILVAMNDAYVDKYEVVLRSLADTNSADDITIHLIYDETLSTEMRERFATAVRECGFCYAEVLLEPADIDFLSVIEFRRWGIAALYRLIALSKMDYLDRFLWIDGDTLVLRDITDFYYQDFENNLIVAMEDAALTREYKKGTFTHLSNYESGIYVNSGVVLFNVAAIKGSGIIEKMWDWTKENAAKLNYPDQDIINEVFMGKIKYNDYFLYNCQVGSLHWTREDEALSRAMILHFVGGRPWEKTYRKKLGSGIDARVWWNVAKRSNKEWGKKYLPWKMYQLFNIMPWIWVYKVYFRLLKGGK